MNLEKQIVEAFDKMSIDSVIARQQFIYISLCKEPDKLKRESLNAFYEGISRYVNTRTGEVKYG